MTHSTSLVRDIERSCKQLESRLKKGFEVAMFMESSFGRLRVYAVASMGDDTLVATVRAEDQKSWRYYLIHVGQVMWSFDVIQAEDKRARIGFGQTLEPCE